MDEVLAFWLERFWKWIMFGGDSVLARDKVLEKGERKMITLHLKS